MPRNIKILIIIMFMFMSMQAQQIPRFSQFIFNEFIFNPAVAGIDGQTVLNLTGRKEWLGFSQGISTPESYAFTAQTRFLKSKIAIKEGPFGKHIEKSNGKVGLGISLFNDANGIFKQTGMSMAYAYHVHLQNSQLSLGLALSIFQLQLHTGFMNFKDQAHEKTDFIVDNTSWIPDLNAGLSLSGQHYRFGIACTQMMQSQFTLNQDFVSNKMNVFYKRNYYLTASIINQLNANPRWEYEPSFMLRVYDFMEFKPAVALPGYLADIMLRMIYEKNYWAGLAYRTSNEFIFMLGLKLNKLYFSYSFDYGNNGISQFSYGSHEISITAKFGDATRRYKWLERY